MSSSSLASARSGRLLAFALVALLVCVARWPGMDALYGIDDRPLLTSPILADPANLPSLFAHNAMYAAGGSAQEVDTYRPLSIATFLVDRMASDEGTRPFHRTNLLLHLLATALALALTARLVPRASFVAMLTAGVFVGLHPAGAEAHVWINGRSDVLMTLFGLAAVLVLLPVAQARRLGARELARLGVGAALFLAGCLSKESLALAVPGLVVLASAPGFVAGGDPGDTSPSAPDARLRAALRATVPIAASLGLGAAAYAGLRLAVLGGASAGGASVLTDAVARLGVVWFDGARTVAAPTRLAMRQLHTDYADLPSWIVGWPLTLVALALGAAALWGARRSPLVLGPLLVFACTLAPVAVLTLSPDWPGMNRYPYLTIATLAPILAWGVDAARARWRATDARWMRRLAGGALAAWAVVWGLAFAEVVRLYGSPSAFALAVHEENPRALHGWTMLGGELMALGRWDEAAAVYATAREASGVDCRIAAAQVRALRRAGRNDDARAWIDDAVARCAPPPPALLHDEAALAWGRDDERAVTALLRCLQAGSAPGASCEEMLPAWRKPHALAPGSRARLEAYLAQRATAHDEARP